MGREWRNEEGAAAPRPNPGLLQHCTKPEVHLHGRDPELATLVHVWHKIADESSGENEIDAIFTSPDEDVRFCWRIGAPS